MNLNLKDIDRLIKSLKESRYIHMRKEFPECFDMLQVISQEMGLDIVHLLQSRETSCIDIKRYLCVKYKEMGYSVNKISLFFGINHSTTLNHIDRHAGLIKYDGDYLELTKKFEAWIQK